MNIENLTLEILALQQRLQKLHWQAVQSPAPPEAVLPAAFKELQLTLEELQVTQEELRQQNEELVHTRHAVEAERRRYQELFDFAPDGYLVTDMEGVIHEANRAAAALLNVLQKFLAGKPLIVFIAEQEREAFHTQLSHLLRVGQVKGWEVRLQPREGAPFHASLSVTAVRDAPAQAVSLRWLLRDITGHKQDEEALRRAHGELEMRVQERTAALATVNAELRSEIAERKRQEEARKALERQRAEFLALITHDLRNPLGVIIGYTDILLEEKEGGQDSAGEEDILERIRNNALTAVSLVTNYLDLSKIEAGQLTLATEPVALNGILHRVEEQYEAEARRRHLTLELQLQQELPAIVGDHLALERIFANLLHNALKFTPERGSVTISSARQNGEVVAAITDTGLGIAAEEIPFVFEKYRRAERVQAQEGTGLGLFIVKALVEAHGGRVQVQSAPGQGACFTVFLPSACST